MEPKEWNEMDKLDKIFYMQKMFNDDVIKNRGLENIKQEEWMQKLTLAMLSEIGELLDEFNYKWWKNEKPLNIGAIKEELIDILHFFASMCLRMGMTSDEVYDIYMKKNEENFNRQYGKSIKKGYEIKK